MRRGGVLRRVFAAALVDYGSWMRSPRTLLAPVFIAAIGYLQMSGYENLLRASGLSMHYVETLYYEFSFGCNMPMTTALFLMMLSELPGRMRIHPFVWIRLSRGQWLAAQILYSLMMVLTMLLMLLLSITVFSLPLVTAGCGWSDMQRMAAGYGGGALIELSVMEQFSPFQALMLAIAPMFFFWLTMALVILLFGLWGRAVLGMLLYAFFMVAHVTIYFECFPFPMRLPMHYATLINIVQTPGRELEELGRVLGGYAVILFLLIAVMAVRVKHAELDEHMEA